MSEPTTQFNDDHALEALIKLYECQLIMTQDTIDKLRELKDTREELKIYREREALRLEQNNPDLNKETP